MRSCIVLKDAIAKNFVATEHHSFTFVFTFSIVVIDLPTDCIFRRGVNRGMQIRRSVVFLGLIRRSDLIFVQIRISVTLENFRGI